MHQEIVSIRISHQELLRKMLIFSQVLFFSQPEFLSIFKLANIPLVFKKTEKKFYRENYRPISILRNI